MSKGRKEYTATLPGFQVFLAGRPRLSGKEKLRRTVEDMKRKELWEFKELFSAWLPDAIFKRTTYDGHSRNRIFTPMILFWAYLNQLMMNNISCVGIVKKVQSWTIYRRLSIPSSNTSAYCQGRSRLSLEFLTSVGTHVLDCLQKRLSKNDLWFGHQVVVLDGTGLSMPDTPANQDTYPQHSEAAPGCGFPQMNVAGLFCLATGALMGFAYGNKHCSENRLFRQIKHLLQRGMVLLADRGFCNYLNFALATQADVECVMRLRGSRGKVHRFQEIHVLPDGSRICKWMRPIQQSRGMDAEEWANLPEFILVRLVKIPLEFNGFRTTEIELVTTLTDWRTYSPGELGRLYLKRWKIEVFFRDIKTVMGMEILHRQTPAECHKELQLYVIAHNLLRGLIQDAARMFDSAIDRISFKGTLQQLREWMWLFFSPGLNEEKLRELRIAFFAKLRDNPVPERPFRTEPRAKKRRGKSYLLLNKPRGLMREPYHRGKPERVYGA